MENGKTLVVLSHYGKLDNKSSYSTTRNIVHLDFFLDSTGPRLQSHLIFRSSSNISF